MKRWICIAAALVLLMGCFTACDSNDTADASSQSSSAAASSKEAFVPDYEVPEGYCDVNAAIINAGASRGGDVSEYFDPDAEGYAIYNGTYMVNAEVLERLTQVPVVGDGQVMWSDFEMLDLSANNPDPFTGRIPVSKLHDPVYMSMALPSELQTYLSKRINASNMAPADAKYRKLVAIGAVYKEKDAVIPDDAEITVCIGKIQLLINTEADGWFVADEMAHPNNPMIYYLPWSLEGEVDTVKLANSSFMTTYDDHIEIKLKGSMLNGTYNVPDEYKKQVEGSVLHFWGTNWQGDGSTVKGCVSGYTAWIKEPEYVGKVVATIGADWRTDENKISQAFSGHNYKLTTEPRLIFGHNVGPKAYDTVMDSKKVQQLLGLL